MSFPKEIYSHGFTSFASNQPVAFASKLFLNELPTQNMLIRRFPLAFEHYPLCLLCHNDPESLDHIGNCSYWSPASSEAHSNLRSYSSLTLKLLHHSRPLIQDQFYSE